ncbi:cupin domain-containing protein [Pseudoalteromonas sp. JBTF-M23]|uniref:Cupin domain-containing protein n=1 Tax=Pseudoalteromonas caenipelagi TaxID=2726988 RepID=A0A849VET4_9GAMM|nr:cupin domain-containing protein [Pseudoalteromonas caenipelagi]NOU51023.1 cupin domain-containing protein [Pseudoalteromonas caenipelagi]
MGEKVAADWFVRKVGESPVQELEGIEMYRVLSGTGLDKAGCEYVTLDSGKELEPHVHKKGHAFILVLEGSGEVYLDGKYSPIEKLSMINIPPGVEHGLRALDEPLVVYGFQVPPIIEGDEDADIYFTKGNRKGTVSEIKT